MIVPSEISDRLLAECMGRPQAYAELGRLCDSVGGRTSGAESGRKSEEWAHALMSAWGLENVRYEALTVTIWKRGALRIEATEPAAWQLTALAHGNSPSDARLSAPVIDVGHGERSDYQRLAGATAGKVALCDEGVAEGRRSLHRSEKMRLAAEFGASALFIYSSASGGLPRTGNCCKHEAPIPSIGVSQEDGLRLLRLIRASPNSAPQVRLEMSNQFSTGSARNVIGDLRGSSTPDEIVLAGAHLDSWDVAQGATDNGLGSAIVLEMGRSIASLPRRPLRTTRYCLWAAEEIGLCGSRAYAVAHAASLDTHVAVLNFDMTADPYGFWLPGTSVGEDAPGLTTLRGLADQLAPLGMRNEFIRRAGLHSDHQPFMLEGVQTIGMLAENRGQGAHYYHSVGDTFDKVLLPSFARAAAVGSHTMWALADSAERPFARLNHRQIRTMIDEAELFEALEAEEYDGPIMHMDS